MAMEEELKTAKDEVTRLEGDLTNCKREFLKDSKTGEVKKQRLSKKDTPSWLSNWAAGMIYHNLLRVKTAAEYQHTRTEYKLLIRDRIQVEADKLNAPTWHILAFEKCATHCDVTYYPGFNKTGMTSKYAKIWEVEGAVDASVGAKRVLYEVKGATMERTGMFINCEDGLQIPW